MRGLPARWWSVPVALAGWEPLTRWARAVYFPPPSVIAARLHEMWFSGPATRLFLTDDALGDVLPSLGRRLLLVVLPAAAPKIFAGLRLSVSLALIMMIVSELVGSTEGIGYRMLVAQSELDIPSMWAAITLIGLLGYGLNTVFLRVERRVLAWHPAGT
ncbi:Binding-protein-dependent transport system inner membrane component [Streptosporangium canum]|uniref:Binding-protein-dependent transport system inner membrane component n=1 Tax=Streptosporangium canum TaxID=324952 RepID=A0A1I3I1N6_9ACTN|nr:ABC transporter permease subunit [Streptosporangium canum]SFI41925.1 Binding-protein-dependent transport system inner membrane component [Streptosporangium canum]